MISYCSEVIHCNQFSFLVDTKGMFDWLDPDPDRFTGSSGSTKVQSNAALDQIWNFSDFLGFP